MGFSKENYKRIKEEYDGKYLRAQEAAKMRRDEVHLALPQVEEIDRRLTALGFEIFEATLRAEKDRLERIHAESRVLQEKRRVIMATKGYAPDYTEVKYECEACGDTGTVDYRMCSCMRRKLVALGLESSGMANLMKKHSFANFDLSYYSGEAAVRMKTIYDTVKKLADAFEPEKPINVLMLGATGLGKTHLTSAMAKTIIEKGNDVYYATATGLFSDYEMNRFGNSISSEATGDTGKYITCDLLIIDDLGTEVINQFTCSCLYDLINSRLNRNKSTIINTNFSAEDLRKKYTDRICSRILGEYRVLPFMGSDVREKKIRK